MLPVVICSFFFISFKGISFKKAALIRNLPGQNEITPQLQVAKSSGITGDSEAAACTISLSSHTSFYLIYLAPYRPFSSPALTICALYPSSTYSSTHIQLYLPSHHYKYPIHPSLPISLSSARPFPYPPSAIYIYRYPHTRAHTHTPVRLSVISSAHLSAPSALHPSPHVSFYPPAHPSLTGRFSAGFTTRGHATFAIYHRIRALASSRSHPSHALVGQERGCHGVSCWTRCLEPARGTW